jgi:hypothetical protein
MRFGISALVLLAATGQSPALTPDQGRLLTMQTRASALVAQIPAYTCVETTSRLERLAGGRGVSADVVSVAVAVVNERETYGWPDGERFLDRQLSEMIGSGLVVTGLFGTLVRGLLISKVDDFEFAGEEKLNSETALRYNFQVPASEGPWKIRLGKEAGVAGRQGSLWVDPKNLELRRVEVSPMGLPDNVGLKRLHLIVDFEVMVISERKVLLPAKAWVDAQEQSGRQYRSHVFFNHCRTFGAESTLSSGSDGSTDAGTKSLFQIKALPKGLEILASLQTPVDCANASPGDELEASIEHQVIWKGRQIIAPGARLVGHIRQLRPAPDSDEVAVTIEFDRIEAVGGWVQFYAEMKALGGVPEVPKHKKHPLFEAAPDLTAGKDIGDPEIPGVVTIYLPAAGTIAAGTAMTWKTEDLPSGIVRGSMK